MAEISNIEESILQILSERGVFPDYVEAEIKEKMDIGLTLGEVLIGDNYITQQGLADILLELYRRGRITLNEINDKFYIDSKIFFQELAKKFGFTYIDLDTIDIDYRLTEKIPLAQLRRYEALPIKDDDLNIYIAFKNPFDINAQDRIQALFPRKLLKVVACDPQQVVKYLSKVELSENIKDLVSDIRAELRNSNSGTDGSGEESGILKLIETIVKQAVAIRGSDIHIEPTETNCVVRTRIDGVLSETFIFDKDIYPPLISRLKLLSDLNIAEKRRPQDGRFSMKVGDREFDFRISTLPIVNGESTVMRILDKSKVLISLDKLGMHPKSFKRFTNALNAPYGIVLVTGPTGSGKTTTLYAALNDMKGIDTKIITVEDPVEYQLTMIQQVHVNEKAGLTFASALRSILRQDPDTIMIGEIRDQETLRIAIQAALTGHLVLSTLHTNDAINAIPRIVDMGIEPYLISGSVMAIEAQRLVRRLCPKCKQPTTLPKHMLEQLSRYLPEEYTFYRAVGCDECAQTGYAGREMISEVLEITDKMQSLIAKGASKEELRKVADEDGFIDMFHDGIIRAARGSTTVEEIYRVAKE